MSAARLRGLLAACALVAVIEAPAMPRCADYNPQRNAYAGDLHVHTALSLDAATQDTRARPRDAYRFARGETLGIQPYDDSGHALRTLQLERALDFAAVTDHSELLGEVELCQTPGSAGYDSWQCRVFRSWPRAAYYLFNYTASQGERLDTCGADGAICREAASGPWQEIQQAAAEANDATAACRFSSFVGYEWTGSRGSGENLHRNVIFSGAAVPRLPPSFVDTLSAEQLWATLDQQCSEALPGCDWLAIPHNSNLSAGRMFEAVHADGRAYDASDAARRARAEPLFEIMQHKGASECTSAPTSLPADEYCDFEQLPYDSFAGQNFRWQRREPTATTGFLRDVLRAGLQLEHTLGVDPYRMGVIGSTDTHLGAAGAVSEARFIGHGGAGEPAREGVPRGLPDRLEFGPGGLAMVWAEENSRESLFAALRRRETYATSGPRMQLRFFGGPSYPATLCDHPELAREGYAGGVPMGGELHAQASAPVFVAAAARDAVEGAPLQRLQIVKGWIDADDRPGEHVFTVAGDADNGADVDPRSCEPQGGGADSLCAVWTDPSWQPGQSAWYYARVLENPSCRWSARVCAAAGVDCDDPATIGEGMEACCSAGHHKRIQERAWSSPIWLSTTQPAR